MAAPAKKVLPFEFRVCNQDQQACRPGGKTRLLTDSDRRSGAAVMVQHNSPADDPLASDFSNLTPGEVAIFKIRTAELMALHGKGRLPNLTPAQWKARSTLSAVCGNICLTQMTPLRVLRVKIVALLSDPKLAKCNFKKTAVGLSETGALAVQTLQDFIKLQIQRLVKGISLLEKHVAHGNQDSYDTARDYINATVVSLRSAEIDSPEFRQALELAGHLQTCLADQQALFHFLLAPLGCCAFKGFELNSDLFTLSCDALRDLEVCVAFFKADVREAHRSIRDQLKQTDIPQKGSFKQALQDVEAVVDAFCADFSREAVSLQRSEEMAILVQHFREIADAHFNTAEIGKIRRVFAAFWAKVERLSRSYTTGLQRFSATTKVVEERIKAMPSENPAVREMSLSTACYYFFDFYIRDFNHIFRMTAVPFYMVEQHYSKVEASFQTLQAHTLRPFDSQYVAHADLIFLTLHQQIEVLDRLSRDATHQQAVYNLYIRSASVIGCLQEAFLTLQKRGAIASSKNPMEKFEENLLGCMAFCALLSQQSPCRDEPAFKEAFQKLETVLACLKRLPVTPQLSDVNTRTMATLAFMPIGRSEAFSREFAEYASLARQLTAAYAVQFEDLAVDLQARMEPLLATIPRRLKRPLRNMVQLLAGCLTSFKQVAQSLPSPRDERAALQYVMTLLNWRQQIESVDAAVFEEACRDVVAFIDKADAFPDGARVKASLAQFQTDFGIVIYNVQMMVEHLHRPLFSWSRGVILEEAPVLAPQSRAVVEQVSEDEDQVEELDDGKGAEALPVAVPKRVEKAARPFADIEPQLNGLLFLLSKAQHAEAPRSDRMGLALSELRPHVLAVREEFCSDQPAVCPFAHTAALYSGSALIAEQALKFLLVQHIPGDLQPYEDLLASHDLSRLLQTVLEARPQFAAAIHPDAVEMMGDVQGICLSGRYLEDSYGAEATILKRIARLAAAKERTAPDRVGAIEQEILQLMRTGKRHVVRALNVVVDLLSASTGVDAQPPVEQQKLFPLVIRPDAHPRLFRAVADLAVLKRRIEVRHLASQQPIRYGNTAGNAFYDQMRVRQIVRSLNNMEYYFRALNELFSTVSTPHTCYNKSNGLLLNASLLLEQACLSIIAYLDIPADNSPVHVLFETVNAQGRPRPRAFDHRVENLFKIIERFAARRGALPPFVFSAEEVAVIALLNQFIGGTSRYLSGAQGLVADNMRELRVLSELLYVVETGFRTEPQDAALRARFGQEESEWRNKILAAIAGVQEGGVFPLVERVLAIVEKLMHFNLSLRLLTPAGASASVKEEDGKQ